MLCLTSYMLFVSEQCLKRLEIQSRALNGYHDILYNYELRAAKHKSDFKLTNETRYRALSHVLLCACCEDFVLQLTVLWGTTLYNQLYPAICYLVRIHFAPRVLSPTNGALFPKQLYLNNTT